MAVRGLTPLSLALVGSLCVLGPLLALCLTADVYARPGPLEEYPAWQRYGSECSTAQVVHGLEVEQIVAIEQLRRARSRAVEEGIAVV